MPEVRFATANALFETFPMASDRITVPPSDAPSLEFLRDLVTQGKLDDAVLFCAYLLGRREAVWWTCRTIRRLMENVSAADLEPLQAAEAWVKDPEPERRQAAQQAATRADQNSAATWAALAAAWSGGAVTFGRALPIAPPPELTPHAAAVAIKLAGAPLPPEQRESRLKACIEDGARLAEFGLS